MSGFLTRWLFAFLLLSATYNPTEWNYVQWTLSNWRIQMPIALLVGLILLAGYIIYLRATLRSIGLIGMLLVGAIVGASVWVLVDQGLITFGKAGAKTWVGLVGLSFMLGIGMSWSHVRRFLSGQADVDDVDE
jgi:hypothetical protein